MKMGRKSVKSTKLEATSKSPAKRQNSADKSVVKVNKQKMAADEKIPAQSGRVTRAVMK